MDLNTTARILTAGLFMATAASAQAPVTANARRLQNRAVCINAPVDAQPLAWLDTRGCWAPAIQVRIGSTLIDPVAGITTTAITAPAGTPLQMGGACMAPGAAVTPAPGEYTFFLNSGNSCHLSSKDSAGTIVDIQAAAGGMVYPAAGLANSTGSGWGASYAVGTAAHHIPQLDAGGKLAAVILPDPGASTPGGVRARTCTGTDKLSAIGTDGVPVCSADQGSGAAARTQILFAWTAVSPASSNTYYMGVSGSGAVTVLDARNQFIVTTPMTISSLHYHYGVSGTLQGASANSTIQLLKNGSACGFVSQNLDFSAAGPTLLADTSHTCSVTSGDVLTARLITASWTTSPTQVTVLVFATIQ